MIQVKCIYPTVLDPGGYIDRDQIVSIPESMTGHARVQRNFRLPDGSPIKPVNLPKAEEAMPPEDDFDGEIAGLLTLTKDDLLRRAQALGLATSQRMSKETIAHMIVDAGVPPTFN